MTCSERQLMASIDGSHKKRNTSRELVGQVLGVGRRRVDQADEPGDGIGRG